MNKIISFIIVLGLFLLIDLPVILYLNKPMYRAQFARINKQDVEIDSHIWLSGGFAYLLLALGIYWFIVRPEIDNKNVNYLNVFGNGALLGLIIYGVYNGTNMATIHGWGAKEFWVDTIWGTILSGIISLISIYLIQKIK